MRIQTVTATSAWGFPAFCKSHEKYRWSREAGHCKGITAYQLRTALSPVQWQLRQKGASLPTVWSGATQASMALVDYEVQRLQRIANNRKRMEEMGIFAVRGISLADT